MLKKNKFVIIGLLITLLLACDLFMNEGYGTRTDIAPPKVSITSHIDGELSPKAISLTGDWSDDFTVKKVELKVESTGKTINANLTNSGDKKGKWSSSLELPEGDQTVVVVATDTSGHTGSTSLVLLVSEVPPVVNSPKILRSSVYSSTLKDKATLEGLNPGEFKNIDLFQNSGFKFNGTANDFYRVESITIYLKYGGNAILTRELTGSELNNWSLDFTRGDLVAANSALASGRHYLEVVASAKNEHGIEMAETSLGWFCWYPESDKPYFNAIGKTGREISIQPKEVIQFQTYDDDGVDAGYYEVYSEADWGAKELELNALLAAPTPDWTTFVSGLRNAFLKSGERTGVIHVDGPEATETKYALLVTRDINGVYGYSSFKIVVLDAEDPMVFVESPVENTFPLLYSGTKFKIKGYAIDNSAPTRILVSWVPDGYIGAVGRSQAVQEATNLLDIGTPTTSGAVKVWEASILGDKSGVPSGYKGKTFELELDIIDDFKYSSVVENSLKTFLVRVIDDRNNTTTTTYILDQDTTDPGFSFISPGVDLDVWDPLLDQEISFNVSKANGLGIEEVRVDGNLVSPVGGVYKVTLPAATLSEGRVSYNFEATDRLGRRSTERRTVIYTSLPSLEKITSTMSNRTYKVGDPITLQAIFSKPVKITGSPRLNLAYGSTGASQIANYRDGSDTGTILFDFTIPEGVSTGSGELNSTGISLNGGKIESTEGAGGDAILNKGTPLQDNAEIKIDGVSPRIVSLTLPNRAYKEGDSVPVTIKFSENIRVTGSPVATFVGGSVASFENSSGSTANFTYKVLAGDNFDPLAYNESALLAGYEDVINDEAGNNIILISNSGNTDAVIDTGIPLAPLVTGVLDGGMYNSNRTVILDGTEGDAALIKYSENGGVTWKDYPVGGVNLGTGSYSLVAYQVDRAGNRSPNSLQYNFKIDVEFPTIEYISCEQPGGNYPVNTILDMNVGFSRTVKVTSIGNDPALVLTTGGADYYATPIANVTDKVVTFRFTVPSGLSGVSLSDFKSINQAGITDEFGNTPSPVVVDITSKISSLSDRKIDSTVPTVTSGRLVDPSTLEIEFSENIEKEIGFITIKPDSGYYIPTVLTQEEFNSIYNSSYLGPNDRKIIMELDSEGQPLMEDLYNPATNEYLNRVLTIGPYFPTTHGLTDSTVGSPIADTTLKYVLAFDIYNDPDPGDTYDGKSVSTIVSDIKRVMDKARFRNYSIDITSPKVTISGKILTVLLDKPLKDGVLWDITLDSGIVKDGTGNTLALSNLEDINTGKVSIPVIRVNRYSHDSKFENPYQSKVNVRVDSETVGSTTTYGIDVTASSPYLTPFTIGGGNYQVPEKIVIEASSTKAGLTDSTKGYEGAIKSVILYDSPNTGGWASGHDHLYIQGSNIYAGVPTIPGFPIRDASPDGKFSKRMFLDSSGPNDKWFWFTWEIVDTFHVTSVANKEEPDNWNNYYDPNDSYPIGDWAKNYIKDIVPGDNSKSGVSGYKAGEIYW